MTIEEAMFILQHGSSEGEQKYLLAARNVGHYIKHLCEENAELKRLLRLAVEDIESRSFCNICANNNDEAKCKKCKAVTLDMFQWKHAEEAMKILEDNNG